MAQDVGKEFDEFVRRQNDSYASFKNKADAEFEAFLRQAWTEYRLFAPERQPSRPKPVHPSTFRTDERRNGTVTQDFVKEQSPLQLADSESMSFRESACKLFYFYGTPVQIDTQLLGGLSLDGISENAVADVWHRFCQLPYQALIDDCLRIKKHLKLNDWGFVMLAWSVGKQCYEAESQAMATFLQMAILVKAGYRVRLAVVDDMLKLLVGMADTMYGVPYLRMNEVRYYVFCSEDNASNRIRTYKEDFPNAKQLVSLAISEQPQFSELTVKKIYLPRYAERSIRAAVNKNLIDFYADYPQCSVELHYRTPLSPLLREMLYPQLRNCMQDLSESEAVDWLLNFVQTAFKYQTDDQQFGFEKPFFADENFFYPACDCEDRSILFATLVRDLLGLKVVLLVYPNHIATAVHFNEAVEGDKVQLENGEEYLVCDPTFVGAPVGHCMERYRQVRPQIIE